MMTFFKKVIAGVMTAAMVAALAGCGGGTASSAAGTASTAASGSGAAAGGAIDKIKSAGVLKVGVKADVPKYSLKNPQTGKYEGFEDDLAADIAGKILGDKSKVEFTTVNAKTRGPLLDKGDIDMVIATFTITDERKKTYDFSDPYMTDTVGFLVKKDSGLTDLKSMNGKTIGVAQSATSKDALQQKAKEAGVTLKFAEFATYPEIKAALDSGRVDVFSVDKSILNGYLDDKTEILSETYAPQDYGIATKKGNDDLAKLVNDTVKDLKSSGELQKMIDKWEIK
jgi:putative glutamine transport system substrate-binding protein